MRQIDTEVRGQVGEDSEREREREREKRERGGESRITCTQK